MYEKPIITEKSVIMGFLYGELVQFDEKNKKFVLNM
jgi:hypothetical protein